MAIPQLLPKGTFITGEIVCDGVDISKLDENATNSWRQSRIALVPQGAMNSFTPHLTIERHITEVLECHLKMSREESKKRAALMIRAAGLEEETLHRYPHELSGGQKQRAALAVALSCEPDFLLADEPTTALDVITQKEVLDTIVSIVHDSGMGMLLVTHDLPLAAGICDSLIVMKDGAIVERGPAAQLAENPAQPYTKRLIKAIRDMD
jgi:ABC-type glutathione transport system ATPase component